MDKMPQSIPVIKRLGLPDLFTEEYGSQDSLLETYGLQADQIAEIVETTYITCLEN